MKLYQFVVKSPRIILTGLREILNKDAQYTPNIGLLRSRMVTRFKTVEVCMKSPPQSLRSSNF